MGVHRRFTAALAVAVVVSTCVSGVAAGADPAWRLAPLPGIQATSNLWDVAAADAANAWAVGIEGHHPDLPDTAGRPMILKWNGTTWSHAPMPTSEGGVSFNRVAAPSAHDVWVVGGPRRSGDVISTHLWRYDGSGWTEVPYPAGNTSAELRIRDLSVVDGRAWLVGYRGAGRPVLHEWTGQAWREHQPPAECVMGGFPNFCHINTVKAFAPDDVWAAGNGWWSGHIGPVLFHYNGTAWRAIPVAGTQQAVSLQSLDGTSSKDVWAVGDTGGMGYGTAVVRSDGTTTQLVGGVSAPKLPGVAVGASGAPWVVGNLPPSPGTAFETYRAGAWSSTPAPAPPGTFGASYNAITAVPGTGRMIAVGNASVPNTSPLLVQAVIAQYGES